MLYKIYILIVCWHEWFCVGCTRRTESRKKHSKQRQTDSANVFHSGQTADIDITRKEEKPYYNKITMGCGLFFLFCLAFFWQEVVNFVCLF